MVSEMLLVSFQLDALPLRRGGRILKSTISRFDGK